MQIENNKIPVLKDQIAELQENKEILQKEVDTLNEQIALFQGEKKTQEVQCEPEQFQVD